jgi:hypothetical protein
MDQSRIAGEAARLDAEFRVTCLHVCERLANTYPIAKNTAECWDS